MFSRSSFQESETLATRRYVNFVTFTSLYNHLMESAIHIWHVRSSGFHIASPAGGFLVARACGSVMRVLIGLGQEAERD